MIFPDVDPAEWAKRFKLPIRTETCAKCQERFVCDVPILMQGCAGFSTPVHGCGEGFTTVLLTPKSQATKDFWNQVLR